LQASINKASFNDTMIGPGEDNIKHKSGRNFKPARSQSS